MTHLIRGWPKHLTPPVPGWQRTDPLDRGLVGDWRFNENTGVLLPDYSGYGNHGTLSGPTWVVEEFGPALDFDGNDYVTVPYNPIFNITGDATWEAFLIADVLGKDNIIAQNGANAGNHGWFLMLRAGNKFGFAYCDGAVWHIYEPTGTITTGEYLHLAFTYTFGTAASATLYVNGISAAGTWTAGNGNQAPNYTATDMRIGSDVWDENPDGRFALIRVYDRLLSAAEIRARSQICFKRAQPLTQTWMMPWGKTPVAPPVGGHMTLWGRYWGP